MTYVVRRIAADEWQRMRELRLDALRESPEAYGETHADCAARPDGWWRERAERHAASQDSATFVAVAESGDWVGMASAGILSIVPDHAHVYSVYVTPESRGSGLGVAGRLMESGIGWAREHLDAAHLTIGVNEGNERAFAFYRRLGFKETGKAVPCPADPARLTLIMGYPDFR